jgi:hypothetical protein
MELRSGVTVLHNHLWILGFDFVQVRTNEDMTGELDDGLNEHIHEIHEIYRYPPLK